MMKIGDEKALQLQLQKLREDAGLTIKQAASGISRQYAIPAADLLQWEQAQLPDFPVLLCLLDYYHVDDLNQFFGWKRVISQTAITIAEFLDLGQKVRFAQSYCKPPALSFDKIMKRKRHIHEKSIADVCLDLKQYGIEIGEQEYIAYEQGTLPGVTTILAICKYFDENDLNDFAGYRIYPYLSDEAVSSAKILHMQGRDTQKELVCVLRDMIASHTFFQESNYDYALGDSLRCLRLEAGLSIADLADELGFDAQSMYLWEKGRVQPTLKGLLAYAELFDVSIDYLFKREKRTENTNDFEL